MVQCLKTAASCSLPSLPVVSRGRKVGTQVPLRGPERRSRLHPAPVLLLFHPVLVGLGSCLLFTLRDDLSPSPSRHRGHQVGEGMEGDSWKAPSQHGTHPTIMQGRRDKPQKYPP